MLQTTKMHIFLKLSLIALLLVGIPQGETKAKGYSSKPNRPPPPEFKYKDNSEKNTIQEELDCPILTPALLTEIHGYQQTVNQIFTTALNGSFKGRTYDELAKFVDKFPKRTSGSPMLEDSIDYMLQRMSDIGLQNVRGEQVLVPEWIRGEETATLIAPYQKNIVLLGLGTSVGTPPEGIEGDVLVVESFEELQAQPDAAKGKIVVFNQAWRGSYGETVPFRTGGATAASKVGAIATLIRSIAPFSLDTPHTGGQTYADNVTHIPTACISQEDAELLHRLQMKGEKITIKLKMLDYNLPLTTSRNVVGEIVGSEVANQVVAVTGHIDSWDVGQGAMDDGGGILISVEALALIKALNLHTPRRTLRAILWTSEEVGLWGVADYARQHKAELANWSAVFESDSGTFLPRGLDFAGNPQAGCIVQEILKLCAPFNTSTYARYPTVSSDITVLIAEGVPGLSLNNANDNYFWYHHTEADTISMEDPDELDLGTALWAATSYVLADLSIPLPRNPPTTP